MTQDPLTPPDHDFPQGEGQTQETEGDQRSITDVMRPGLKVLGAALLLSALVHVSPLIGALFFDLSIFESDPVDLDWFGPQEDLSGIGHGGSWAQLKAPAPAAPPEPEAAPESTQDEAEEVPEKEEKEILPEKEEPAKKEAVKEEASEEQGEKPPEDPVAMAITQEEEKPKKPKNSESKRANAQPSAPPEREVTGLAPAGPSNLPSFQNYAPGNARMMALIRLKGLRGTPYEAPLAMLFESLPDYRLLLDASQHGALDSIDSIFLASAAPRYLQHTFLAVRHTMDEQGVKQALDARYPAPPPWGRTKGYATRDLVPETPGYQDPRKILLIQKELAIVTRPEWLEQLTAAPESVPEDARGAQGATPAPLPMLEGLGRLESIAPPDTLVQLSVQGLRFYIPGMGDLPSFQTARMQVVGVETSQVTLDVQFATKEAASSFAQTCPRLKTRMIDAIPMAKLLGLDTYISRLECKAKDEYATVKATYTQAEVLRLVKMAAPFMPRPPALDSLPKPPPRLPTPAQKTPQSSDMGYDSDGGQKIATPSPLPPPTPQDMGHVAKD